MDLPLRESRSVIANVGIESHRLQVAVAGFTSTGALYSKSILNPPSSEKRCYLVA
jgi:hypothetical protein